MRKWELCVCASNNASWVPTRSNVCTVFRHYLAWLWLHYLARVWLLTAVRGSYRASETRIAFWRLLFILRREIKKYILTLYEARGSQSSTKRDFIKASQTFRAVNILFYFLVINHLSVVILSFKTNPFYYMRP